MEFDYKFVVSVLLALLMSMVISFAATPLVKKLAEKVGAVDVPRDNRRMHDHPIPRMGGFAIFIAFVIGTLIFCDIDKATVGILLGSLMIVTVGVIDDISPLPAWVKLLVQIAAAAVAVGFGLVIEAIANPFAQGEAYIRFGVMAIPLTVLWIVGVTNSVNLIDGLDGLSVGVSAIASVALLVIALFEGEDAPSAIMLACLVGGCIGFLPYNLNPAKIFAGDTGALFLGFVLSTVAVKGLFKFYAVVSFVVPFIVMGLPVADTTLAFARRIAKGKSPFSPDRGHLHHKLIDMGLNQKQAVAVLYCVSVVLGFCAVVIATGARMRLLFLALAFIIALVIAVIVLRRHHAAAAKRAESEQADAVTKGEDEKHD